MTVYLTIITTALVVTQIVRVIQNAIQLHLYGDKVDQHNEIVLRVYKKLERYLDGRGAE